MIGSTIKPHYVGNALASIVWFISFTTFLGWIFEIPELLKLTPQLAPMQPNTALCFLLLSTGLILRYPKGYVGVPALVLIISGLTLIEYGFDVNVGIDTFLVHPFFSVQELHPGRISLNTTISLTLYSSVLLTIFCKDGKTNPLVLYALIFICAAIAVSSLIGYSIGLESAYGWSDYTRMTILAALCSLLLSVSITIVALHATKVRLDTKLFAPVLICIFICMTLTTSAWIWAVRSESKSVQARIEFDAEDRLRLIEHVLNSKIDILKGVTRFFGSSEDVTRQEYASYTLPFLARGGGLLGIDWCPRVLENERVAMEAEVRQEGFPNFMFQQLDENRTLTKRSGDAIYFPVLFSEPLKKNVVALGFDHYADPLRKRAMDKSLLEDEAVLTEPFRLFRLAEQTKDPSDFLIVIPLLREKEVKDISNVRGFVVGVLRLPLIIQEAFQNLSALGLNIDIYDVGQSDKHHLFRFGSSPEDSETELLGEIFTSKQNITVGGRRWEFSFSATNTYLELARKWQAPCILLLGIALSAFISSYIFTLQSRNVTVKQLVDDQTAEIIALNHDLEAKVSERTQELNDTKRFAESIAANATSFIYVYDLQSKKSHYTNRDVEEFLGYDAVDKPLLKGGFLTPYVHPEDAGMMHQVFDELANSNDSSVREFEIRLKLASGKWRWLWNRVTIFKRTDTGEPLQIIGTAQDITERKRAEAALGKSEKELRNAFTQASIGMALVSLNGSWLRVNPPLCALVGYSQQELLQKTFQDITYPADLAKDLGYVQRVLSNQIESYQMEKRYIHKLGHVVWVLLSVSTVKDEHGNPIHFVAQIQDITARRAAEFALEEKNVLLAKATEFKSQFLANMSHEVRTPLTSIIGYTESLLKDSLSESEHDFALETVLKNSQHLLGVINHVLDFSKIEAGKMDVETIKTSLFDLISDVGNLMQHKAVEQRISFGFDYVFPLPRMLETDPTRLKQILINLIGNAIKFTKLGGVKVVVGCDVNKKLLTFAVTDTGIGMSSEQRAKLFQAFTQCDTSTTREFGGTGLGLVISHQLAIKLGGEISVDSVLGQGSTFTLTIDAGKLDEGVMTKSRPESGRYKIPNKSASMQLSGRVLLAEDGPDNQNYISFVLKKAGIDFLVVENGALAVEAAHKEHFDLILMDMQMPVMDGYTATRKLREDGCTIPIVALTANIMQTDIEKCHDAGCSDFLGKPFVRAAFLEKIGSFLRPAQTDSDPVFCELQDGDDINLIISFVDGLSKRVEDLRVALAEKEWDAGSMFAHRLRGAHMFGYGALGDSATCLEKALHDHKYERAQEFFLELAKICGRIKLGRYKLEEQQGAHNSSII